MSEVQRALDLAEERGADALQALRGQWETLTLAETITVYASFGQMLEQLWRMAGLASQRIEQIRADERAERPGGAARRRMDAAMPHLDYGREAVLAALSLSLGIGSDAIRRWMIYGGIERRRVGRPARKEASRTSTGG